ncbi:hypothetical protein L596_029772 [Steinernema carpocapsae]|uniref:Acyl-CoA thioesterase-like C-terminal domain-containing protein n=1 Tax=Steinernema carpocapsae TaxID=34508 RepID=A0A4U5LQS3_STECR|nr:hypothetical protein L596_029772 [Steinernema carpocapsae]
MSLAEFGDEDSAFLSTFQNVFDVRKVGRNLVRSDGRHTGGGYRSGRLYGGHTAAQIHLAFRCLHPNFVIHTLRVNFVAPGNVKDALDYEFTEIPGGEFQIANVTQNKKRIASAKIRFGLSNELLDQSPYFMPQVNSPLSYPTFYNSIKQLQNENVAQTLENLMNKKLFEMRPVDVEQVIFTKHSWEPMRIWCSLNPMYKESISPRDGISVVVLLSDYMVIHPARSRYVQFGRSREFGDAASLNHTVWFHVVEDIDPDGWFLYESSCTRISNTRPLIEARIFDQRGRCLISTVQEAYINAKI